MSWTVALPQRVMRDYSPPNQVRTKLCYRRCLPVTISNTAGLRDTFNRLADKWQVETQFFSSVSDMVLHPAYQEIISKGFAVVPFILDRLKDGPDHWYWALAVITNADPTTNVPDG